MTHVSGSSGPSYPPAEEAPQPGGGPDPETPLLQQQQSPEVQKAEEDKRLFPFRIWYLMYFAALACVQPYLPVYLKGVGLTAGQVGILVAFRPILAIVATPLWGMLTDVTARPKEILLVTFGGAAFFRFCLGFASRFWTLLPLALLAYALGSPCLPIVDVQTLKALSDRADYGKQRALGAVSWGATSLLTGLLVAWTGALRLIFWLHLFIAIAGGVLSWRLTFHRGEAAGGAGPLKPRFTRLYELLSDPRVVSFFCVVAVMGFAMGAIDAYLFIYLQELGASTALMGLALTVMCVAEAPAMFFVGKVIAKIGVPGVIYIVLACYIVRLSYYSLMPHPWLVLPIEVLHGITFGWASTAGSIYASSVAPSGLEGTTQGLYSAAFWGVGPALGILIGGFVYQSFGAVILFRAVGLVVAFATVLFIITNQYIYGPRPPPLR